MLRGVGLWGGQDVGEAWWIWGVWLEVASQCYVCSLHEGWEYMW